MEVLKGMGNIRQAQEVEEALKCWELLSQNKLTQTAEDYFNRKTAEVYLNTGSGYVFLSDEYYNTVMINGDKLDLHINLSYSEVEGFLDELIDMFKDGEIDHPDDIEQLKSYLTDEQKEELKVYFVEDSI